MENKNRGKSKLLWTKKKISKNLKKIENIFKNYKIDFVVNLAAQAGVRYSLIDPKSYIDNNILGFFNLIETSKKKQDLNKTSLF